MFKVFGKCLIHRWKKKSVYYDNYNICMWSSGTVHYRKCKDCKLMEEKGWWDTAEWHLSHDDIDFDKELK